MAHSPSGNVGAGDTPVSVSRIIGVIFSSHSSHSRWFIGGACRSETAGFRGVPPTQTFQIHTLCLYMVKTPSYLIDSLHTD